MLKFDWSKMVVSQRLTGRCDWHLSVSYLQPCRLGFSRFYQVQSGLPSIGYAALSQVLEWGLFV